MSTFSIKKAAALELLAFCEKHKVEQFFIAKDHGAYIGATKDKPLAKGEKIDHSKVNVFNNIHYLLGCNPDTDEDSYEECRYRFGGDDFGVHLPTDWLRQFRDACKVKNKRTFSLKVTDNNVSMSL